MTALGVYQTTGAAWVQLGVGALPPVEPVVAGLVYSASSSRANPLPLDGATSISPSSFVFIDPDTGVTFVDFYIDTIFQRTEATAPFDLRGATATGPEPLNLSAGTHTVTAEVNYTGGRVETVSATFSVAAIVSPPPPPPPPPPSTGEVLPNKTTSGPPAPPDSYQIGLTVPVSSLTTMGGFTASTPGATYENKNISGVVTIRANGVTFRNCKISGSATGILVNLIQGFSGLLIDHCEIVANGVNGAIGGIGDLAGGSGKNHGDGITVRDTIVHGVGDGVKAAEYSLYQRCYIAMRQKDGSVKHIDGIQNSGRSHITVEDCWIDQTWDVHFNAAVFNQSFNGSQDNNITDIIVRRNHVCGGAYTIHNGDGKTSSGRITNLQIYNNVFYRGFVAPDFDGTKYIPNGGLAHNEPGISAPTGTVFFGWAYNDPTHAPVQREGLTAFPGLTPPNT